MHQSTRRAICRLAFLLLCVLPTLAVGTGVAVVRSPRYQQAQRLAWQQRLSRQLGLAVQVRALRYPERHVTLLEEVRLADVESHEPVARCRRLQVAQTETGLVVQLFQAEVQLAQLQALWTTLQDEVLRRYGSEQPPLLIIARDLTLQSDDQAQSLSDVELRLEMLQGTPELTMDFQLVGSEQTTPAQFRMIRRRDTTPPRTRWELHTGPDALPCQLLALRVPALRRLGSTARFTGSVWAQQTAAGWEGDLSGTLEQVDLSRLVTDHFTHKLSGLARVRIQQALLRRGRLVEATGSLEAETGVVSKSLLQAASQELQLRASPRLEQAERSLWPYERLALSFRLDVDGFWPTGQASEQSPGAVIVDGQGALLASSARQVVPPLAVARMLAPQSRFQVPATQQTERILRALPIPSVVPLADDQARDRYTPVRLKGQTP